MARTSLTVVSKEGIFPVVVDPNQRIKELVRQGQYDEANPNITEANFSRNGNGGERTTVELRLARLLRGAEIPEVAEDLDRRDLRSATLLEILRFGIKFRARPRTTREPIFAPGAVWSTRDDDDMIVYLGKTRKGRRLDLFWAMFGFTKGQLILVAPK